MSDESGKDLDVFSEISDMDSDTDEEDGVLMSKQDAAPVREAVKDEKTDSQKKVLLVGASEKNGLVTGDNDVGLGVSLYEMVRQKNIQERQEMFRETFKEIGELKNSLLNKKKPQAPRDNQSREKLYQEKI